MPTTVIYNFPYPALGDAPNGPVQIQALAQAVENKIATMDTVINAAVIYTSNLASIISPIVNQIAFLTTSQSFFKWNGATWVSYNPVCHAYQTSVGTQSLVTSTATAITFDGEIVDDISGHSTSVNPSRYTPNVPGYYACWGIVVLPATGAYDFLAQFRKNGNLVVGAAPYGSTRTFASGFTAVTAQAGATLSMNGTTDYIELWTNQNSGGPISTFSNGTDQQSAMRITRIGPL